MDMALQTHSWFSWIKYAVSGKELTAACVWTKLARGSQQPEGACRKHIKGSRQVEG